MTEYISSSTKTFEKNSDFITLDNWLMDQIDLTPPDDPVGSSLTKKRYRITVSEVNDIDPGTLREKRKQNLRNVGSKIIKNEVKKFQNDDARH